MTKEVEVSASTVSQEHNGIQSRVSTAVARGGYTLFGMVAAFWWVWLLLAQMNFHYEFWYQWLDIQELIAEVGPQNEYKLGLEQCTAKQHAHLFSEIVSMIHQPQGQGLETIRYCSDQGNFLLRQEEIEHLQDVALLISGFKYAGWLSTLGWCVALIVLYRRASLPSFKQIGIILSVLIGSLLMVLMLLGPVTVFYKLHEWIFPEEHQWFFYYQESLMTTLMKAPDLFGGIASVWVVLASIGFMSLHGLFRWRQMIVKEHCP